MPMEESGDLYRHLLSSPWETGNDRRLCHIVCHRETDSTERLNSFRHGVYEFALFLVMFVVEQMELVKRRAGHLPVMLLVHVPKRYRICEELVKILDTRLAGALRQGNRQLRDCSIGLNLDRMLIH